MFFLDFETRFFGTGICQNGVIINQSHKESNSRGTFRLDFWGLNEGIVRYLRVSWLRVCS
jgi:hypothetical protein